jgi:AcrR family transcriptional regulator
MARPPRKRLPPDERRALIEDAAARLFAERGYSATRLDEIAAAAHVTKPVLYRHFDSKKALYLALLAKHRALLPRFVAPEVTDEPFLERLPALLAAWFAYVQEQPYAWQMIFRDTTGDPEIRAFRAEVQATARAVLAELLGAQPELSVPEEELEPMAELLRSAMVGLTLWWLDHPDVPRPVIVDLVARAWRGLLEPAMPRRGRAARKSRSRPPPPPERSRA